MNKSETNNELNNNKIDLSNILNLKTDGLIPNFFYHNNLSIDKLNLENSYIEISQFEKAKKFYKDQLINCTLTITNYRFLSDANKEIISHDIKHSYHEVIIKIRAYERIIEILELATTHIEEQNIKNNNVYLLDPYCKNRVEKQCQLFQILDIDLAAFNSPLINDICNIDLAQTTVLQDFKKFLNEGDLDPKTCDKYKQALSNELSSINLENLLNDDLLINNKEVQKYKLKDYNILDRLDKEIKNSDILKIYSKYIELDQRIQQFQTNAESNIITKTAIDICKKNIKILFDILINYQNQINLPLFDSNDQKIDFNKDPVYVYLLSQATLNYPSHRNNQEASLLNFIISNKKCVKNISKQDLVIINKLQDLCNKFENHPEIKNIITSLRESLNIPVRHDKSVEFDPIENFNKKYHAESSTLQNSINGKIFMIAMKALDAMFGSLTDYFKTTQQKFMQEYKKIIPDQNNSDQSINQNRCK